jgi:two-component system cell cycle response regulator
VAALVVIYPASESAGTRIPIHAVRVTIGRSSECDVRIDGEGISRRHARLSETPDGWFVEDLDSVNGTFVNDVGVNRSRLRDGDFLRLGTVILKFDATPNLPGRRPSRTWN